MSSTLICDVAARPVAQAWLPAVDSPVLRAVGAPAGLVHAADDFRLWDTSAQVQVVGAYATAVESAAVVPAALGMAAAARTRQNTQGPPARGTPV